jgi:hypothetical protein
LIDDSLFERLAVGRMLVDFDYTFGPNPPNAADVIGDFGTVLSTLPSTKAIQIIKVQVKERSRRRDFCGDVRYRPVAFLLAAYLDLLFPNLLAETFLGKNLCLAIGGYTQPNRNFF